MFALFKSPPARRFDLEHAELVSVHQDEDEADEAMSAARDGSWLAVARVDVLHQERVRPEGMSAAEFWERGASAGQSAPLGSGLERR